MGFDEIPPVRFFDLGVSFRYLVFRLKSGEEQRLLVRGMNFRPYEPDIDQRIINQTIAELKEAGFREGVDELDVGGGGTAATNPYYETLTLFGADAESGSEANRDQVFELVQAAFPQHKVEWYSEEHAAEVERKEQEAKAKAKAAREAAKAKRAAAAKKSEEATEADRKERVEEAESGQESAPEEAS